MRKLPTGELCAVEPHAQFGGRGGRKSFPTSIIGREPTLKPPIQGGRIPFGREQTFAIQAVDGHLRDSSGVDALSPKPQASDTDSLRRSSECETKIMYSRCRAYVS